MITSSRSKFSPGGVRIFAAGASLALAATFVPGVFPTFEPTPANAAGTLADANTPVYVTKSIRQNSTVTIDAPTFDDPATSDKTETNPAPDGTTFKLGDNPPDGATVSSTTGKVTVKVPQDATTGESIVVPIVVTYRDNSTDNVTATVKVNNEMLRLTQGIKLVDSDGNPIKADNIRQFDGAIASDGDSSTNKELSITYNDKTADFSGLTVTITDKDGNTFDAGDSTKWRGAKGFPVMRNFGLNWFPYGTYDVAVSGVPEGWALRKNPPIASGLKVGKGALTISANSGNMFVYFGLDANNNGVVDKDETTRTNDPKYKDAGPAPPQFAGDG